MKKYFLSAALGIASLAFGQYYPGNNYPNNNYPQSNYPSQNGNWDNGNDDYYSQIYDDQFNNYAVNNFPDDYYYNYPTDYYPSEYYQNYYNDYRQSLIGINWNQLFVEFRLSPLQIRQIVYLNNRYNNYNSWQVVYGPNPDRWYYDRYYALERILGPQIFLSFQNRYYRGSSPIVYFQNYRRSYYMPRYSVVPRYRNININVYRVDRNRFFNEGRYANNGRNYRGFTQRNNTGYSNDNRGFHDQGQNSSNPWRNSSQPRVEQNNTGFHNSGDVRREAPQRIGGYGSTQSNGGFRGSQRQNGGENRGFRSGGSSNSSSGNSQGRSGGFRGGMRFTKN